MTETVDLQAERERRAPEPFCHIDAATAIEEIVNMARQMRRMASIVGDPGVGKTTALKRYADDDREAVYCVMSPSKSSMIATLMAVGEAVGRPFRARTAGEVHNLIVHDIRDRLGVLLVDEAQHVNDRVLDELRCIHDESGVPIVFAGNSELRSRFGNSKTAGFGQFLSRIGPRLDLASSRDDIRALAFHLGADTGAANWLVERAAGNGNLRTVDSIMAAARDLARSETVNRAALQRAAVAMGID